MKILFVSSEVVPFAKTGGLADVSGALPLALEGLKQELAIVTPFYKSTLRLPRPKGRGLLRVDTERHFLPQPKGRRLSAVEVSTQNLNYKFKSQSENIVSTKISRDIKVYFVKSDKYFNRDGLYGDKNGDYPDNLERFSYFCKQTLEFIKEIDFQPDIIHCNDWQTALLIVYLKTIYKSDPFYQDIKTVFSIHNLGYQGIFEKGEFPKLGLDWSLFNIEGLEFYDKINLLKGALIFSDIINTVSPTYAKEIMTKQRGFGLEGVLLKRKDNVFGILNGLDYNLWDPAKDSYIFKNYSLQSLKDKYVNKTKLKRLCKLEDSDFPLFGFVGRLAGQKGIDIFSQAIEELVKKEVEFVILGTGEEKYHKILTSIAKRYPKKFSIHLKFDNTLAHQIYAGSDVFLIPSEYEPCGLGQMISFKYGSLPLVHKTGGLADTVNKENGFVFEEYTKDAFLDAVRQAMDIYKDKHTWMNMVKRAFSYNFSWEESAKKYVELYKKAAREERR